MGSDTDIGMIRNSSDWLGMNFYPNLSPARPRVGGIKDEKSIIPHLMSVKNNASFYLIYFIAVGYKDGLQRCPSVIYHGRR